MSKLLIKNASGAGAFRLEDFRDAMSMVLGRKAIGRVAIAFDEEAARLGLE